MCDELYYRIAALGRWRITVINRKRMRELPSYIHKIVFHGQEMINLIMEPTAHKIRMRAK